VRKADNLATFM